MARRYRYSFVKKKEAPGGKRSVGLAVCSFLLFFAAAGCSFFLENQYEAITGGICLFATMLAVYGFIAGLASFSGDRYQHRTSVIGSIANGIIMLGWLGFYLMGLRQG